MSVRMCWYVMCVEMSDRIQPAGTHADLSKARGRQEERRAWQGCVAVSMMLAAPHAT